MMMCMLPGFYAQGQFCMRVRVYSTVGSRNIKYFHFLLLLSAGSAQSGAGEDWLPQLTQMVFDDLINFQDPLVVGHVPFLKAVSLTMC